MYPNEARFYQSKGKIHKLLNQIHTIKLTKSGSFLNQKKNLYTITQFSKSIKKITQGS